MNITKILILVALSISVAACSSMRGNVIPQKGPTMEQIYDSMGRNLSAENINTSNSDQNETIKRKIAIDNKSSQLSAVTSRSLATQFHRLKNPELKMYVFPHLSGEDQLPVPGYYTAFNVYERDYYALPEEQ